MPPSPDTSESATKQQAGRRVRIVLLDDVPEVRESIRVIIHAHWAHAEIVECENGDEAWKIVQDSPPDLLISDLTHPGLGGQELSQRLAEAHPELPVLVISAFQQGLDALREPHQAYSQAPRGFLAKPFTVEAIQAEVGRLIAAGATGR
jgi:CheY-like chemotaxis protein